MTQSSLNPSRALGLLLAATLALAPAACDGNGSGTTGVLKTNATLSGLETSAGPLSPAFSATVTNYQVAVPFATTSITFTPHAGTNGATIVVNGETVVSGGTSSPINLSIGTNTITVVVTNPDGLASRTYTIAVVRAAV